MLRVCSGKRVIYRFSNRHLEKNECKRATAFKVNFNGQAREREIRFVANKLPETGYESGKSGTKTQCLDSS